MTPANHNVWKTLFLSMAFAGFFGSFMAWFIMLEEDPNVAASASSDNDASCIYAPNGDGKITCTFSPETSQCSGETCNTSEAAYECACPITYTIETETTTKMHVFSTVYPPDFNKEASSEIVLDITPSSSQSTFGVDAIELCAITRCHRYSSEFEDSSGTCSLNLPGMQQGMFNDYCESDDKENEACWATSSLPFHCNLSGDILFGAHVEQMKSYATSHTTMVAILMALSGSIGIFFVFTAFYSHKMSQKSTTESTEFLTPEEIQAQKEKRSQILCKLRAEQIK